MSKHLHCKKNDYEQVSGATKHRFNAEYSDELEFNAKKGKKASPRRASQKRQQFADLH
jgi:hypothetical protein